MSQSNLETDENDSDSERSTESDEPTRSIEDTQRENYEEHFGSSSESSGADDRDLNPGINDGENLEVADIDDFFIQRSGEGEDDIEPVFQKIPGREQALRVKPFTSGMYQKYLDPVDYEDDEKLAEMFNKAFPDLDESLTAEDVANGMIAYGPRALVDVIERAAGKDMQTAMDNRNVKLLNEVDPGKMQELMQGMNTDDTSGLRSFGRNSTRS
jgi:hypothetical protein